MSGYESPSYYGEGGTRQPVKQLSQMFWEFGGIDPIAQEMPDFEAELEDPVFIRPVPKQVVNNFDKGMNEQVKLLKTWANLDKPI